MAECECTLPSDNGRFCVEWRCSERGLPYFYPNLSISVAHLVLLVPMILPVVSLFQCLSKPGGLSSYCKDLDSPVERLCAGILIVFLPLAWITGSTILCMWVGGVGELVIVLSVYLGLPSVWYGVYYVRAKRRGSAEGSTSSQPASPPQAGALVVQRARSGVAAGASAARSLRQSRRRDDTAATAPAASAAASSAVQVEVHVDRSEPLSDASPLSELLAVVFAKLDVATLCPVRALPSLPPNAQSPPRRTACPSITRCDPRSLFHRARASRTPPASSTSSTACPPSARSERCATRAATRTRRRSTRSGGGCCAPCAAAGGARSPFSPTSRTQLWPSATGRRTPLDTTPPRPPQLLAPATYTGRGSMGWATIRTAPRRRRLPQPSGATTATIATTSTAATANIGTARRRRLTRRPGGGAGLWRPAAPRARPAHA